MRFDTKAVHVGEEPNLAPGGSGDVVMPIHLASTFARARLSEPTGGYEYSRSGNPTRDGLERRLAALEGGSEAICFASGLAAETATVLTFLRPGDHVVLFQDLYGGTRRLFSRVFAKRWGLRLSYVDARDPGQVAEAMGPDTRMVWLESPTNPLLGLCDIRVIADMVEARGPGTGAGSGGGARGCLLVVDNTFMTPVFQRPLELGAHLVVHSTTKYLNGHSDSVGGVVITGDHGLAERLRFHQNAAGAVLSPFDSFLVLRGLKTLGVRMAAHQAGAARVTRWLEGRPEVRGVIYPGLESHPQHELAARQMHGFGGMVSVELEGGLGAARRLLETVRIFALAESLGGVESLMESPALMTHASVAPEARRRIGLSDGLVRLSVGIEDVEDLLEDLERGLRASQVG